MTASDTDTALDKLTDYIMSFDDNKAADREVMKKWLGEKLGEGGAADVLKAWGR